MDTRNHLRVVFIDLEYIRFHVYSGSNVNVADDGGWLDSSLS